MKPELKPCPFCGAKITGLQRMDLYSVVMCMECEAEGPPMENADKAIEAWNNRAEAADDYPKSDALNTQPSATDRKEIMKPALERSDLAFIYDELRQSGKDRAAELVRAALLAKCGQQGYTAADMASAAADGFRKGQEATPRQAAPQKPKQEHP